MGLPEHPRRAADTVCPFERRREGPDVPDPIIRCAFLHANQSAPAATVRFGPLKREPRGRTVHLQFGADPELEVSAPFLASRPADLLTEIQIPVA